MAAGNITWSVLMADTREFQQILREHIARYPLMCPQDYGKLAYQNEFGPEHILCDKETFSLSLQDEWEAVPDDGLPRHPEKIGNNLCRFHLTKTGDLGAAVSLLTQLCVLTAQKEAGTASGLAENLACLEALNIPGMADWLAEYRRQGYPAVHHSPAYRKAYHPHYRLLRTEYAGYFQIFLQIAKLAQAGHAAVLSIDGRCGSGKTRLAELIHELFPCNIVHMDDYYVPMLCKVHNWAELPGGNIDFSWLIDEVIVPLQRGEAIVYRPFDCASGKYRTAARLPVLPLTIVEGSYSQHPRLTKYYDLTIFLTCAPDVQVRRLKQREGPHFSSFEQRWIPMEENYIRTCTPDQRSDFFVDTSGFFDSRPDRYN